MCVCVGGCDIVTECLLISALKDAVTFVVPLTEELEESEQRDGKGRLWQHLATCWGMKE